MMPRCQKIFCNRVAAYLSAGEVVTACVKHKAWFDKKVSRLNSGKARLW